ncbi:helix-turn-helix domain-containing protein [Agromyces aurantiacus]|uniref:Helix-turn-helix domain-containing protein n=1 Tax=Agromyces aurantiacus TaxID=165814 RepID=A0ABV9R749_9MICO|nr:metalloregulator ArsR/SmtB family transcription factor [Agromyces aurantiacus]MBM7504237.1 DNA-binding transcriptional ArsR family regulator [Agromyces aurantiacus]
MTQPVHPFAILADPVRRRIVEILAVGEHSAGTLGDVVATEHGISASAVSHHLRTLRDHGAVFSTVDPVEPRSRTYRLSQEFLALLDDEVERLFRLWDHRYGTTERRAPLVDPPRSRPSRPHRFGVAAERRAEERAVAWGRRDHTPVAADPRSVR